MQEAPCCSSPAGSGLGDMVGRAAGPGCNGLSLLYFLDALMPGALPTLAETLLQVSQILVSDARK